MSILSVSDDHVKNKMREWLRKFTIGELNEDIEKMKKAKYEEKEAIRKNIFEKKWAVGIPEEKTIKLLVSKVQLWFSKNPDMHLYDVGAGSGLWLMLMNVYGLPSDRLHGIELDKDKVKNKFEKQYWPINFDSNAKADPTGILFISWGFGMTHIVYDFIQRGGKYVIILGETKKRGGLSEPAGDHFRNNKKWNVTLFNVFASYLTEGYDVLSFNVKK